MAARTAKHEIRHWIRKTGWDVVRFAGRFEEFQRRLFADDAIDLVLDVGANQGQYSQRIRQLGYTGPIVAFEPIKAVYDRLVANFAGDRLLDARNCAVGSSEGMIDLHVSGNTVSSSTLAILDRHVEADPASAYVGVESVESVTLDALDLAAGRIWLKVDVQGAEGSVLAGARRLLGRVRVVQLELSLVELYVGGELIEDTVGRLRSMGLAPAFVKGGFQDPRTGRMLQAEALFVRE